MQTARHIMTGNIDVIKEDETVQDAAKRLARGNIGAMPICTENNELRGMLTDRDIVTKVVATGRDPATVQARELETGKPVTIGADDSIEEAMRTMAKYKVRRLPVIDGHKLVDMISQADLARALPPDQAGRLLENISK